MDDAGIVTAEDFSHGLRCVKCTEPMPNGSAYASVPTPNPYINMIVCAACAVLEE